MTELIEMTCFAKQCLIKQTDMTQSIIISSIILWRMSRVSKRSSSILASGCRDLITTKYQLVATSSCQYSVCCNLSYILSEYSHLLKQTCKPFNKSQVWGNSTKRTMWLDFNCKSHGCLIVMFS